MVVRDSTAASRAWEDFGIRFADLGSLAQQSRIPQAVVPLDDLEDVLDRYIQQSSDDPPTGDGLSGTSPYYQLFLGRLLSSQPISQHEAFLHPVATVIAISSATSSPIETLRNLYQQTAQGPQTLPQYANPEYLRYYVLVHDEDKDDFAKSSALFEQMKRHFGLHCHLLRLRSAECLNESEYAEELPVCEWLTASEELKHLDATTQLVELNLPQSPYIYSSDAVAIRTFVRELVAQSVVPHMEQRIALWNEQIASRRRGISGRFMSLSKRWAGIGSTSRGPSSNTAGSGASGNYDSTQDQYPYDTPEALLRRMADFAMMLRDYKLAASTYELLRSDYSNDKAWKYLAGANEMCCTATLLNPLASGSAKLKIETFDQMLETASYSYLTRCSQPILALRSILLGVELLKVRGPTASEMATKWAVRALQLNLVSGITHVLVSERVTGCLAGRTGIGSIGWGTRKRKAALWSITAADEWMKLGRAEFAAARLDEAQELYRDIKNPGAINDYMHMTEFMTQLQLAVKLKLGQARQRGLSGASAVPIQEYDEVDETTEKLDRVDSRHNRRSLMGAMNPLEAAAPLSPGRTVRPEPSPRDDDFE